MTDSTRGGRGADQRRLDHSVDHAWHVAINAHVATAGFETARFMYDAKHAADEVPRLALLFGMERRGELAKTHAHCNVCRPEAEPVPDNHLSCCLGVECRACPFLLALDGAALSHEQRDQAKAWTCVAHVIASGGDAAGEGFVLTVDDRMYWDRVYASLTSNGPEEVEEVR